MDRNTRLEVLALMHEVYGLNQYVTAEDGTQLRFEPPEYHNSMAQLYRGRKT